MKIVSLSIGVLLMRLRLIPITILFLAQQWAAPSAALAQRPASPANATPLPLELDLYTEIKNFDFNERVIGNFDDTPLNWSQERGDGLPFMYAKGCLDEEVGHEAPPSFRLDIATGNVLYEYRHPDLIVVPACDYYLVGYIKPKGLEFASAFISAYFVDRFGERIEGSERISRLIRAHGKGDQSWQQVAINLPGEFPLAYALRIQFWVLQDYAWRVPDAREIDPIVRQDVYASAWLDDLSIYRLPRVQLRLSHPAGLVLPDREEQFLLKVSNATSQSLQAELRICDMLGHTLHQRELEVPPVAGPTNILMSSSGSVDGGIELVSNATPAAPTLRATIPSLEPGRYRAWLRLMNGSEILLERYSDFAVLPELPGRSLHHTDFGVDLGKWSDSEVEGVVAAIEALGCGAVKIGIPMAGDFDTDEKHHYFRQLSRLLRELTEKRVEATGVILPPVEDDLVDPGQAIHRLVQHNEHWSELFSPVFAHFGAVLPTWQLGDEVIELGDGRGWPAVNIDRVRKHLRRFVTIPKLAIPQTTSSVEPVGEEVASIWVPATIPSRALPRQLRFLVDVDPSHYWLRLDTPDREDVDPLTHGRDVARRITLAKAMRPGRIFLPAPFEYDQGGGQASWQPTTDFIVLRTMFHFLAGKRAVSAMTPIPDSLAVFFSGVDSSCMVTWSWKTDEQPEYVELYLGDDPQAYDAWAHRVDIELVDGRARIPVGPTPLIVTNLDTPLALLQASYRVDPTYVQTHATEPYPTLMFSNPYPQTLSGEIVITPPAEWNVDAPVRSFVLPPGESLSEVMRLYLPPRQMARVYDLDIKIKLHSPRQAELHFVQPLTVGLREVSLNSSMYWSTDDLIVEQSLHNLSPDPVSFTAFCDAPGHARQERFFSDVAPGEVAIRTYTFRNARKLEGCNLLLGVQEIDGERSLNQFAEVSR